MTEKPCDSSDFSFRTFDLYRRIIEVLQENPAFLENFKTGIPSEEVCHAIIKQIFLFRQTKEKVAHLSKYLNKNVNIIVNHVENLPSNWNDAITYTDHYIKMIRNYLKKKHIGIKTEIQSVKELAKDIGEYLHENPSETQIEAIREYLKYDLRNPKKSIISTSTCKISKSKRKKLTESPDEVQNSNSVDIKKNNLKMIIKKLNKESPQIENQDKTINETFQETDEAKTYEVFPQNIVSDEIEEELLKMENATECTDVQMLLQAHSVRCQNDLLHVEDSKDSLVDLLEKDNSNESYNELTKAADEKTNKIEYLAIMEIDEQEGNKIEENEIKIENSISEDSVSDYDLKLKRKTSCCNEDELQSCAKRLLLSPDMLNLQDKQYLTISYTNNNKTYEYEAVHLPALDTSQNKSVSTNGDNDSSNFEIEVVDIKDDYDNKSNPEDVNNQEITNENVKVKLEKEQNISFQSENKMEDDSENRTNHSDSDVENMTYTDALKLIETVISFCTLRNEISLEEYLVLRRTRDKIHWRSLKEENINTVL